MNMLIKMIPYGYILLSQNNKLTIINHYGRITKLIIIIDMIIIL